MSSKISNGLISLSSPLISEVEEQSTELIEKQCIVSNPGSETEQTTAASLRRRDLSPLGHRSSSSSPSQKEEEEEEEEEEECELEKKEEFENPKNLYVWSSIILSDQKPNESLDPSKSIPPPYVHPFVKKTSKSSPMSEKSLQVCTESLGSETGTYEFQEEEEEEALQLPKPKPNPQSFDGGLLKYQYHYYKHSTRSSFPPPLPSLSLNEHSSLHYHSQRNNGRLVLQAVSVPNLRNCFRSQRLHGRLVLTFEEEEEEEEEEMDDQEEETEGLETEEGIENEAVNLVEELGVPSPTSQKSLLLLFPPRVVARLVPLLPATVAATTSFNACEYFWRNKATTRVTTVVNPITQRCAPLIKKYHCNDKIIVSNGRVKGDEQREMVVLKGNVKGDCLLPMLRSCCCLEPGRPLLIWEPYCIATS